MKTDTQTRKLKTDAIKIWPNGFPFAIWSVMVSCALLTGSAWWAKAAPESHNRTERIARPAVFSHLILPVDTTASTEQETQDLLDALNFDRPKDFKRTAEQVESFIASHSTSRWTASLRSNLGQYYREHGRHTLALQHWEAAWEATKDFKDGNGKRVADITLAHWTRLLASLGRYETLTEIFQTTKGRILDRGPMSQMFRRTQEAYVQMGKIPGMSYRCGTFAMANVAYQLVGRNYDAKALDREASSPMGFTLKELVDISERLHLGLVAVRRDSGEDLVVPSVVHWQQNHYAAIIGKVGDLYEVVDPTFGHTSFISAENINAEASGYFMVPIQQVLDRWRRLDTNETGKIFGRGNPNFLGDDDDQPCPDCTTCPPGQGGSPGGSPGGSSPGGCGSRRCSSGGVAAAPPGMPAWRVSEPYLNLWLEDEPLGYQPAYGPRIPFQLKFKQRDETSTFQDVGMSWECSWLSLIEANYAPFAAYVHLPGGGVSTFKNTDLTATNYYNNLRLTSFTNSSGVITNFELLFTDGAKYTYDYNPDGYGTQFYLTKMKDAQGNIVTLQYQDFGTGFVDLKCVIDATGLTNTMTYNTTDYPADVITSVVDPYNRSITLQYDTDGTLTNITDVAGLSTSIGYDGTGWVTSLSTPYGVTSFISEDNTTLEGHPIERKITITEPTGGTNLYFFHSDFPVGGSYPAADVPTNTPLNTFDNVATDSRNSFYWNPKQYSLLSTNYLATGNYSDLTSTDFLLGRKRHFLGGGIIGTPSSIDTLALERDPSPDGVTEGQKIWYDYSNKDVTGNDWKGDQILPAVTARVMPDGSTWYTWHQRTGLGVITNEIVKYVDGGVDILRTNTYLYSTDGFDLLKQINAAGDVVSSNLFNAYHQVTNNYNALNEKTVFTYDGNLRLTSVKTPAGLTTTNLYGADGYLSQTIDLEINRTNSFTYTNGLVYTHTDERGLTTTNTWDGLQRLRRVSFPDGTYITNTYGNLDLVKVIDRMGYSNSFTYNALRQKTSETNALGRVTTYTYCDCGVLESVIDALTNTTSFSYDYFGRRMKTTYPDGSTVTKQYNLLGQVTNVIDSAGVSITNWFNNAGLFVAASNAFGRVQSILYDVEDRATNSVNADAVSITNTFDVLGRILARTYPDGGAEKFGYSANGLVAYTNQLSQVARYGYDAARRKIAETNANNEVTQFTYAAAGDLLTLTDGKSQTTSWHYNLFGLVTNKADAAGTEILRYSYDANNRLTNRWSAAKTNTVYSYDAVGNLTNISYPVSTNISMSYDPLNRLANMVDAAGTTVYAYTSFGALLSEDGPWANDTVSYTYDNGRRRSGLTLLAPNASAWTQNYGYDSASRMTNITSPAGAFAYAYDATRQLQVKKLTLPNTAYISNTFDSVARLTGTYLKNSGNTNLNSHQYSYNAGNQRTEQVFTATNYVDYTYDNIGQLKTAKGEESGGVTNRLQEQLGYVYDAAGNLNWRTNNALVQAFNVNNLNELTTTTNSGTLTVAGTTTSAATNVTVNSSNAVLYLDNTFAKDGFTVTNGSNTYKAIGKDSYGRSDTNSITINLPATNTYAYDLNGNLTSDGTRGFDYDDENQLICVTVTNKWKSEFTYDGKMRRRIRKEFTWTSTWVQTNEVRYVYDGNLVIQERDANNLRTVSYTRGKDITGTLQGAGGIGGLLARTDYGSQLSAFYHADGNGNITALINAQQFIVAKYLYDPFGNILSISGLLADVNLYRFSSKEYHANSGLIYYLYRYYDPNLQRWPNGDPMGEIGFEAIRARIEKTGEETSNLYAFCKNEPTDRIDAHGLLDTITGTILMCSRCPGKSFKLCVCTLLTDDEDEEQKCERDLGPCIQRKWNKRAMCECACGVFFKGKPKELKACIVGCAALTGK